MDLYSNFVFLISWSLYMQALEAFRPPSGLKATMTSSNHVSVTWNEHKKWRDRSDTYYTLRYKYVGIPHINIRDVWNTSFLVKDVSPNSTLGFTIRFTKGKRKSQWSSRVYVTTPIKLVTTPIEVEQVSTFPVLNPRSLKVKDVTSTSAKIKWRRPKNMKRSDIQAYKVTWKEKKIAGNLEQSERTTRSASSRYDESNSVIDRTGSVVNSLRGRAINTTKRYVIVTDLRPHTVYNVKVQTIAVDGRISNSSRKLFKTERAIIDHPPSHVSFGVLSATKIYIRWSRPLNNVHLVTGYKIQYRRKKNRKGDVCSVSLTATQNEYNITDLFKQEIYKVRIAAKTNGRTGPYTPWYSVDLLDYKKIQEKTTKENIRIETTTIATTNEDDYLEPLNISIGNITSSSVKLTWTGNVVTHDVIQPYRCIINSTGVNESLTIVYLAMSKGATTLGGLRPSTLHTMYCNTIPERFYTFTTLQRNVLAVNVTVLSPFHAEVALRSAESTNMTYRIQYNWNGNNTTELTDSTTHILSGLKPGEHYDVKVTSLGSRDISSTWHSFQMQNMTSLNLQMLTVEPYNSTCLLLLWSLPSSAYRGNVDIKVSYRLSTSSNDVTMDLIVDGASEATMITGLLPGQTYDIDVSMETKDGYVATTPVQVRGTTFAAVNRMETTAPAPPADVFITVESGILKITWLPPEVEYMSVVRWYIIDVFRKALNRKRFRVTGNVYKVNAQTVDVSTVTMVEVRSVNTLGESAPVRRIVTANRQDQTELWYSVRQLSATTISPRSVLLEWLPPVSGELTRYLVRYRPNVRVGLNSSDIIDHWVERSHNNYVLTNLEENEEYAVSVIPYFNDVNGNTSTTVVLTFSDVPDAAPLNVTTRIVNVTTAVVDWLPPPFISWNGNLTGYILMFGKRGSDIVERLALNISTNSYILQGLEYSTIYQIAVAAVNANGTGPSSPITIVRTGVNPILVNSPKSPVNFTTESHEMGIRVRWSAPPSGIPIKGYIVGWGRFISEVYRFVVESTQFEYVITGLRQFNTYIVSVRSFNEFGESPPVFKRQQAGALTDMMVTTTMFAFPDDNEGADSPTGLKVEGTGDEVVNLKVSWKPPALFKGLMEGYLLYYTVNRTFSPETANVVFARSEHVNLKNLEFNTTYYFRVKVQYRGGFGSMSRTVAFKTKSPGNSEFVLPTPIITEITAGVDYLEVEWREPPADYKDLVLAYVLGYGITQFNERQEIVPGSATFFRLNNLASNTTYYISLRCFNRMGASEQTYINATTTIS